MNATGEWDQRSTKDRFRWEPERAGEDPPLELSLAVHRAVAALPAGCRAVFLLHDVHGHTHEEVGARPSPASSSWKRRR